MRQLGRFGEAQYLLPIETTPHPKTLGNVVRSNVDTPNKNASQLMARQHHTTKNFAVSIPHEQSVEFHVASQHVAVQF